MTLSDWHRREAIELAEQLTALRAFVGAVENWDSVWRSFAIRLRHHIELEEAEYPTVLPSAAMRRIRTDHAAAKVLLSKPPTVETLAELYDALVAHESFEDAALAAAGA